jgi:Zn-finger protein
VTEGPGRADGGDGGLMACASCGATAEDEALARLTWSRGTENGRDVWTCAQCSRRHLRSIEGKLDSAWW